MTCRSRLGWPGTWEGPQCPDSSGEMAGPAVRDGDKRGLLATPPPSRMRLAISVLLALADADLHYAGQGAARLGGEDYGYGVALLQVLQLTRLATASNFRFGLDREVDGTPTGPAGCSPGGFDDNTVGGHTDHLALERTANPPHGVRVHASPTHGRTRERPQERHRRDPHCCCRCFHATSPVVLADGQRSEYYQSSSRRAMLFNGSGAIRRVGVFGFAGECGRGLSAPMVIVKWPDRPCGVGALRPLPHSEPLRAR